jgi:hypothetical protein
MEPDARGETGINLCASSVGAAVAEAWLDWSATEFESFAYSITSDQNTLNK